MPNNSPLVLVSSKDRGWSTLEADLVNIPAGRAEAPGGTQHMLGMHFGPPVNASCCIGGTRMKGVQRTGDIGIIPAGMEGAWEDDASCQILRLRFRPSLLKQVAEEIGKNTERLELAPHLQLRDARVSAIGWAIKADLEGDLPSDPLYIDSLTNALAVRLVEVATGCSSLSSANNSPRMSSRQLKMLTEFIESNLARKLSLADLASVAGVSVTHFKSLFRNSTGTSAYQYVVSRRVEYARALLSATSLPASEVALAAGFAHQSHMASTMRRILGHAPSEIARLAIEI